LGECPKSLSAKPSPLQSIENQNPFFQPLTAAVANPPSSNAVTLTQFNPATQSYHLDPSDLAKIPAKENADSTSPTDASPADDEPRLMDILQRSGVDFPAGSRVAYTNNGGGTLYVTNTQENLAKIQNVLLGLLFDTPPPPSANPEP
jgi:hypothetical protein